MRTPRQEFNVLANTNGTNIADVISGAGSGDTLAGRAGNDTLHGGAGDDSLVGELGRDRVNGNTGDDTLSGGDDADTLSGAVGDDTLIGGEGEDLLLPGAGDDFLDGGDGVDTVSYRDSTSGVTARLDGATGAGWARFDSYANVEALEGSERPDALFGSDGADRLSGRNGSDRLSGSDGLDTLEGGAGDDSLHGGRGNDLLVGGGGRDRLDGAGGFDTASYAASLTAVSIGLDGSAGRGGDASGDVLISIERIIGSQMADSLRGSRGGDTLEGGRGNDTLVGGDGNDVLIGGQGVDALWGGAGTDTASYSGGGAVEIRVGGAGRGDARGDRYFSIERFVGSDFNDTITGGSANDILEGGAGADVIAGGAGRDAASYAGLDRGVRVSLRTGSDDGDRFANVEDVIGSSFDDTLLGDDGANHFYGGRGLDMVSYDDAPSAVLINLAGGPAAGAATGDRYTAIESFAGSAFNDTIIGDGGGHRLSGWFGDDLLVGGEGKDVFLFLSSAAQRLNDLDTIRGFDPANDVIEIDVRSDQLRIFALQNGTLIRNLLYGVELMVEGLSYPEFSRNIDLV